MRCTGTRTTRLQCQTDADWSAPLKHSVDSRLVNSSTVQHFFKMFVFPVFLLGIVFPALGQEPYFIHFFASTDSTRSHTIGVDAIRAVQAIPAGINQRALPTGILQASYTCGHFPHLQKDGNNNAQKIIFFLLFLHDFLPVFKDTFHTRTHSLREK